MHKKNQTDSKMTLAVGVKSMLLILIGALLVTACERVRNPSYPRDFVYLDKQKVTSQMALFSFYLSEIDDVLLDDSIRSSEQQQQIIALLAKIETGANNLGAGPVRTSHLVLDENIDSFRADISRAMRDASADPPNYFALGQISGSCLGCHRYRR